MSATQNSDDDGDWLAGDEDDARMGGVDAEALRRTEAHRASSTLYQAGYRDGKVKGEERKFQSNFDEGFVDGSLLGRACGELFGEIQSALKHSQYTLKSTELLDLQRRSTSVLSILLQDFTKEEAVDHRLLVSQLRGLLAPFPVPVLLALEEVDRLLPHSS